MDPRPEGRLPALAGLRFCAALALLVFHHAGPLAARAPAPVEAIRTGGHVWVGLFYVLSGFVLARSYPGPLSPGARREFWAARVARLYPAYLLAFLLAAPFALERWALATPGATAKAAAVAVAALLLVQAWYPPIARLWNAPGWSASVVLAFYAAFPFAAGRLSRLGRRGLWAAAGGAWGLSLAAPLLWLALRPDGTVADYTWNEPAWLLALKFHPLARAGEFLAGVALGLLHARGLSLGAAAPAAGPAALAAVLGVLAWGGAPYPLLHNGLLVPLFAVLILSVASDRGPLARLLRAGPARTLGDASFAVYVLQEPLWMWGRALTGQRGESAAFVAAWAAATVAVAVLVARVVERPARRALRGIIARAWAPAAPPPGPRGAGPAAATGGRPLRP